MMGIFKRMFKQSPCLPNEPEVDEKAFSETQNIRAQKTNEYEQAAARLGRLIAELNKEQHGH